MTMNIGIRHIGAMVLVVSTLIPFSGCRSSSANSSSSRDIGPPPVPPSSPAPYYQAYPQPPEPYNNAPNPQPASPTVEPTPGYSDPLIPPQPSAQKTNRTLRPSNFRFPIVKRQNTDIDQTGVGTDDHGVSIRSKRYRSSSPTQDIAGSRSSLATINPSEPVLGGVETTDAGNLPTITAADPDTNAAGTDSSVVMTPSRTRQRQKRTNSFSNNATNQNAPTLSAPVDVDPSISASIEAPRLLPPNQ